MRDPSHLFVYGTLRSDTGTEWARLLASSAQRFGVGRVRGGLFQLDGYPGMVLRPDGNEWITGELYRITDPVSVWPVLDEYEGCGPDDPRPHEFERRVVQVRREDGTRLSAWAYVYRLDPAGKPRIPSGDYLRSSR